MGLPLELQGPQLLVQQGIVGPLLLYNNIIIFLKNCPTSATECRDSVIGFSYYGIEECYIEGIDNLHRHAFCRCTDALIIISLNHLNLLPAKNRYAI